MRERRKSMQGHQQTWDLGIYPFFFFTSWQRATVFLKAFYMAEKAAQPLRRWVERRCLRLYEAAQDNGPLDHFRRKHEAVPLVC